VIEAPPHFYVTSSSLFSHITAVQMSRAYHIFVGRLSSRAAENRNAAVIEYPRTFPIVGTGLETTAATALEYLSSARYSTNISHPLPSSSSPEASSYKPSRFSKKWDQLNVKVIDTKAKKPRKLRRFTVRGSDLHTAYVHQIGPLRC
jgi:hypothetical protein